MAGNLLYLLILFAFGSCDIDVTQMIEISDMKNVRLGTGGNLAITKSSALHCAVNCISDSSCVSLSYHADEKRCFIYDFVVSSGTAGTVSENGWISYRKNNVNCPTDQGYIYSPTVDWCYKLFTVSVSVLSASTRCNQEGGRLLRIDSEEKQLHITDFLISHGVSTIYIAGHSANRDGVFLYEDGTALSYFNWGANQPASKTSISINQLGASYVWNCGHGTMYRPYMCEI